MSAFCPAGFVIHLERLLLVIFSIAAINSSQMIPTWAKLGPNTVRFFLLVATEPQYIFIV